MTNKVEIVQGDITKIPADIIVNAANTSLLGGGGVDGAIHRVGGKKILAECQKIRARQGNCCVGEAVMTTAGNLPATYVVHTVGPVWNGGVNNEEILLECCYENSLKLAQEQRVDSISFPNISTGIYRFPKMKAAIIALKVVSNNIFPGKVLFVCYDYENYILYKKLLKNI